MEQFLSDQMNAFIKKAQATGKSAKNTSSVRRRSSLHQIIKTKEQAAAFMKLLQSA